MTGCTRRVPEPRWDAPAVYDFAERTAYSTCVSPWQLLLPAGEGQADWLGDGWGEPAAVSGVNGRWITQRRAELRFLSFNEGPLEFTVSLLPYTRSYAAQTLQVRVNGKPVDRLRLEDAELPREYSVTVPPDALIVGENTIELRFRYASARKQQAAFVSALKLERTKPRSNSSLRTKRVSERGAGWTQPGQTRVSWKVAVPRRAGLRVQPVFNSEVGAGPGCSVFLRVDEQRVALAHFSTPPAEPVAVAVPYPGRRGRLEFEAAGASEVEWRVSELCGDIDSRDANVLLLTIDSLRADHVGVYGHDRPTTPAIDALARRGTLFRRAFSCSNFSVSSHASMLTGRYPQSHGIPYNGLSLNRQQITLPALLERRGIKTAAYVNWTLLAMPRMTGRGFAKRRAIPGTPNGLQLAGRQNVYANAMRWIEAERENRFFLWVHSQFLHLVGIADHYGTMFLPEDRRESGQRLIDRIHTEDGIRQIFDAHNEGRAILSADELADLRAINDGMLRLTDDYVGGLMEGLMSEGLDTITAIFLTSDHGMLFGENEKITHVGLPVEELQRVPLIAVLPGCGQKTASVDGFVETVDIAPTILSYLDLRVPRRMQGHDLLPLVRGSGRGRDHVYAMVGGQHEWSCYAARSDEWLYCLTEEGRELLIRETQPRLSFDSVADDHPGELAAMRDVLKEWLASTPAVRLDDDEPMSDEIREMLRKSGYLRYAKEQ